MKTRLDFTSLKALRNAPPVEDLKTKKKMGVRTFFALWGSAVFVFIFVGFLIVAVNQYSSSRAPSVTEATPISEPGVDPYADAIPTDDAARELARQFIADKTGTPVDRDRPMQCVYCKAIQQGAAFQKVNGELVWQAYFLCYGHAIVVNGYGKTVTHVIDGVDGTVY